MFEVISSTHRHLAFLHDAQNEITDPVAPPLKRVVLVGSVYNGSEGFRLRDQYWMGYAREACSRLKLGWDKNFKVVPLNYVNGEDILDPALKLPADVLVVCYIVDRDKSIDEAIKRMSPEEKRGFSDDMIRDLLKSHKSQQKMRDMLAHSDFNVSLHHTKTAWREAAQRVGARAIVTFSRTVEVDHTNFDGAGFKYTHGSKIVAPYPSEMGMCSYQMELILREDLFQESRRRNPQLSAGVASL